MKLIRAISALLILTAYVTYGQNYVPVIGNLPNLNESSASDIIPESNSVKSNESNPILPDTPLPSVNYANGLPDDDDDDDRDKDKLVLNTAGDSINTPKLSANETESVQPPHRVRSTANSNKQTIRASIPYMDKVLPFNTQPGLKSQQYDASENYFFKYNSSLPKFNVKAIYHSYMERIGPVNCPPNRSPYMGPISPQVLKEAIGYATSLVDREIASALADAKAGNLIPSNVISSDGRHLITGKLPGELKDFIDQEEATFLEYVAQYLQRKYCLRPVDIVDRLTKIPAEALRSKFLRCTRRHGNYGGTGLACKNLRYRTYDGSCNNLKNPFWGKANVCHVRFLPPAYQDGIYLPRSLGAMGKPLPSPRAISLNLHEEGEGSTWYTPWHFTWGQFVIHDMMSTPQSVPSHGSGVQCCPSYTDKSKCLPIFLSPDDVQKRQCINFIRSAPCPLCQLGPRQQINLASSYLDHSAMYGTDNQTVASLRTFRGGLLTVGFDRNRKAILPDSKSTLTDQCSRVELGKEHVCFRSGDARVNQQPFIQLIHSIFVRRHNQHARGLARVNSHLSDETLFQEARRLTIAELQHITYYEYLPVIMGPEMVDYFEIIEKDGNIFTEYEEDIDATTWNECASAACRFGHSQVKSILPLYQGRSMNLKDSFFNPELIHQGLTPQLIVSLLNSKSAVIDPFLTPSLKNHLYQHTGKDAFGSDLAAFNIQRGRDHGIPPYVDYVKFCFGYVIKSWKDLNAFMEPQHVHKLYNIYGDFHDIDLFTGGLYEKKAIDADIGPTFACIVGIQFYHLKFGDRYFYTHSGQAGSFTPQQLYDMKTKFSLANLLCLTEPSLKSAQRHAFIGPAAWNPQVDCDYVRANLGLNYNLWRFR